ncbi:MAG: hypothetical protein J6T72_00520 [Alphaproteobacteria bacterium]|nr:hypothetical protein [Alphaproteobacteria bacterium]
MPFVIIISLLIAAIFWVDNTKVYKAFYFFLYIVFLTLTYNTFIIYSAKLSFSPWHDSGQVAYLVILAEIIALLCINTLMFLLKNKIFICKDLLFLPFVSAAILSGYLMFYENTPLWLCYAGSTIALIMLMTSVALFFINFDKLFRK